MTFKIYNKTFNAGLLITIFFLLLCVPGRLYAQFTAGNILVSQENGTTSAATSVFLQEYNTTTANQAAPVSTVVIPTSGAARLTNSGSATSEGFILRSSDSTKITVSGYDAATGTASVANTTAAAANRVVDTVNANGVAGRAATTTFYGGNNIRSAVRSGNDDYWAAGAAGGTIYLGNTAPTATVQTTESNTRVVAIFNGNIYISSGSGAVGLYKVAGLPTTFTTATQIISSIGSSPSPYGFAVNAAETIIYIADDRTAANDGGIEKWTLSGGVWSMTLLSVGGTSSGTGARGLTVDFSGTYPIIYATTTEATANRLVKVIDNGAANLTVLATAPANTAFRGVAFVPVLNCVAPTLSAVVTNDSCFGGSNGAIALTTTGGTSPFTYSWAATGYSAGTQNIAGLHAGVYTVTVTTTGGNCSATLTETVAQPAAINLTASSNSPVCKDSTLNLTSNSTTAGVTYSWTGPNGFHSISADTSIVNVTSASAGMYIATAKLNTCSTSDTLTIAVNPAPNIATAVAVNDTTCGGSNGRIVMTAFFANTAYTVNYLKNGAAQSATVTSSTTGTLILSGLSAGIYSNVTVTHFGCPSLPVGPFTISDPTPPNITTSTFSNTSTCGGSNGTITLGGLTPLISYTVNFSKNGIVQPAIVFSANGSGAVIVTGLTAGTYTNITVTHNGCISNIVGPIVIADPTAPVITSISNNGPICAGGTLDLFTDAITNATYSWTGPNSFISGSQNPTILSATAASTGTYTLIVTVSNCTSAAATTQAIVYAIPAMPVVGSNSPVCTDSTLLLTALSSTPGVTYSWTGPGGYTSTSQDSSILNVTSLNAGTYLVTASANGCTSPAGSTIVIVHPTPVIGIPTSTNPTICAGTDGTITLPGLTGGTSYTVHYTKNGVTQTATIIANASGNVVINNLAAATYANITVTALACPSNMVGPIVLSDPNAPVITSISNNGAICAGSILDLSTSAITNATYSWTGPNNFISGLQNPAILNATAAATGTYTLIVTVSNCTSAATTQAIVYAVPATPVAGSNSPVCAGNTLLLTALSSTAGVTYSWTGPNAFNTTTQNPAIPNVTSPATGTYFVTASANNCTSPAGSTIVVVNPTLVIGVPTSTNPTTCLGTDGIITLPGLTTGTSYTVHYTKNGVAQTVTIIANASGSVVINNLPAGTYDNIAVTTLACPSNTVGPVVLSDPNAPAMPVISSNSPVCIDSTLDLFASSATNGVSYSWTGPGFTTNTQNPVISNVTAANAGAYNVTATLNNCTSAVANITVVINPTPIITGHTATNPTTCSGTNGVVVLNGNFINGVSYTINYTKNGVTQSSTIIAIAGTITLPGLSSGAYDNMNVTSLACPSNVIGGIVLSDPPTPVITSTSSNSPLCSGSTLSLAVSATAGVTYSWTGPNNFISSAQNISIPNVTTAATGTYYITATINNCTSAPDSMVVIINQTPLISSYTAAGPTVCAGSDGKIALHGLTNGISYTVSYYKNSTLQTATIIANGDSVTITGLSTGTYTNISMAGAGGCPSNTVAGQIVLSDPSAPALPVVSSNTPVCQSDILHLMANSATAGVSYSWTGPGFTAATQNPVIANVQQTSAGNYTVTATLNNCISSATTTVVVKPLPSLPVATSNSPVCSGNTLFLTASSTTGVTYSWVGANNFTSTLQDPSISNAQTIASGAYTVTATLNGCPVTDTIHVIVNQTPAAPVVSNVSMCQYSVAVPLTATGTNLLWYTTPTGGMGSATDPVPNANVAGTTAFYVSQTTTGCEGPRALINVTVIPKPAAPVVQETAYTYCQYNEAITLSAAGSNILWYTIPTGGTAVADTVTPATNVAGTYTYYASQTVNGCESDRTEVTVVVNQKPQPPVTGNITYCQRDAASALTAQGQNLLWYTTATGGAGSPIEPLPSTNMPDTMTWYVSQTVNGCESNRSVIQVTVLCKPDIIITNSSHTGCQFDTLSFHYDDSALTNASYQWGLPTGATIISGNEADPIIVRFDTAGTQVLRLTISGAGICTSSGSDTVLINTAPSARIAAKNEVCQNEAATIALSAVSSNVTSYSWNFDGGHSTTSSNNGSGPYEVSWPAPGMYVIGLTVFANTQCPSRTLIDTITVHPLPDAGIQNVTAGTICSGDSVLLHAKNVVDGNIYQWLPTQFFSNNNAPDVYGTIDFSGPVTLQVTNEYGCVSNDSVYITTQPCCNLYLPNAFTPNNDGKNDLFRPITEGHHQLHIFRVQNRWGQTVFETVNERAGWDGTLNGVPQNIDTYYYYISYDCNGKTIDQKGEIYLIR